MLSAYEGFLIILMGLSTVLAAWFLASLLGTGSLDTTITIGAIYFVMVFVSYMRAYSKKDLTVDLPRY